MLQTIWFILWGVLWVVYFMLDGFDLGLGTLMPFLGKTDEEKRRIYNAMGPFWDGNEVWLIAAGGVTFAAFPETYATMFSAMYTALMLLLFALILRGVSFEFRGKVDSDGWRKLWDTCMWLGSVLPAILLGVAFANIFKGIPIDKAGVFHGTLLTYLNPYGLAGGVLFLFMFMVHGALWMTTRSGGDFRERAAKSAGLLWIGLLVIAVVFLVMTWFDTDLFDNYVSSPGLFIIPALAVILLLAVRLLLAMGEFMMAWYASAATIFMITAFALTGLFPNMFPSSIDSAFSRTAFNASSSHLTLSIMLVVALLFVPVVIIYQIWTYRLFRADLDEEPEGY